MPQLTVEKSVAKEAVGLKDGGHVYVRCSNCEAILMDLWKTLPKNGEKEIKWKVRANCPFCGDKSFVHDVEGVFHKGGYGKVKEDDPNDDFPSTVIESEECVDGVFMFKILKANENAKPYRD